MRKSFYIDTHPVFGKPRSNVQTERLASALLFSDGEILYRKKERNICIEQDFKGRFGYLQQYDIILGDKNVLPVTVTQSDLYVAYAIRATGDVHLSDSNNEKILSLSARRAVYIYLPAGAYQLTLSAGRYQLFGFYFDTGIFDQGGDVDFKFLQTLLQAHRHNASTPLVSKDFKVGTMTETYIESLCRRLKKGNLDSQVYIISQLKELIKLSKTEMTPENQYADQHHDYVQIAKTLILAGVADNGILYNLSSLTEQIPLSLKHLDRIFKQITHYTLERYKKHCAAEHSKTLLREGLPVWKVGILMGYKETRSFRRFFKEEVGITPNEYQQRITNR